MTASDLQGMEEELKKITASTGWSDEELQGHIETWRSERNQLLQSLSGKRVSFDGLGDLVWESFPERKELERIGLYKNVKSAHVAPRAITLLGKDGKQQDRLALPADCCPGLIVTADQVLVHAPGLETASALAVSPSWVDMAAQDFRTQHADLHVCREAGLLLACLREAGEVVVCDLDSLEELDRWKIRAPGSWHAINVAFEPGGERAFLSDNVTPQLWIANLESLEFKVWKSGLGILGNLAPGLEHGKIFLSILAPQFSLIYFDLASMQASYSLEIKGKSWAHAKLLPCDPITVSSDGKLVHFLTWTETDNQRTPVVNVIDAEEIISKRRFTLKEPQPTVLMAYPAANPFGAYHKLDFKTWLIKRRLLTASQLESPAAAIEASGSIKRKQPPRGKFNVYQPPAEDKDLWNKIGTPGEALELPLAAEEAIIDLLNWAFYRMTLTNLRIHPEELRRLKKLAKTLREELKSKEVVLAKIDHVLGRHSFETPISRRAVMSLLTQAKLSGEMVRLEDLCPICENPFADGECTACGFRLAWAEGQGHSPGSVSAEPATGL
ncbi:MAG TPA: hypothetical protein V6D23_10220, partial [Candidatus Obscuribacterales bacterium]